MGQHITDRLVYVLALSLLWLPLTGASDRPCWPRHAFGFSAGAGTQPPVVLRFGHRAQADARFMFRHLALCLDYQRQIGKRSFVGVRTIAFWSSIGFKIELDDPAQAYPYGKGSVYERWASLSFHGRNRGLFGYDPPQLLITYGRELVNGKGTRLLGELGGGVMPMWSTSVRYNFVNPYYDHNNVLQDPFHGRIEYGFDIEPLLGLSIRLERSPKGLNRAFVSFDVRCTPTPFYTGMATRSPARPDLPHPTFERGMIMLELRFGYALTWGPPRVPRWLLNKEWPASTPPTDP